MSFRRLRPNAELAAAASGGGLVAHAEGGGAGTLGGGRNRPFPAGLGARQGLVAPGRSRPLLRVLRRGGGPVAFTGEEAQDLGQERQGEQQQAASDEQQVVLYLCQAELGTHVGRVLRIVDRIEAAADRQRSRLNGALSTVAVRSLPSAMG